jgi:hypothetical protein
VIARPGRGREVLRHHRPVSRKRPDGLGLNTTIFTSSSKTNLNNHLDKIGAAVTEAQSDLVHGDPRRDGFRQARAWTALALCALIVAVLFVGGPLRGRGETTPSPEPERSSV